MVSAYHHKPHGQQTGSNQLKKHRTDAKLYLSCIFSPFTFYFLLFILSLRRFTSIIVDKLKEYKVAFRGLSEGKHNFEYMLDNRFF